MNDTTKWIMIVLLLLLIAAAVIVLLRSPGKDRDGGTGAVDRAEDDRRTVDGGRQERLGAAPERGVYDQEADPRTTEAAPVVRDEQPVQDEPAAAPEPSTYDRPVTEDRPTSEAHRTDEEVPSVDEAPSQEPPAGAAADQAPPMADDVTYAEDIEATSGPEAVADRDTTGDDGVAAEPYQPAAGAYEGGEPGTYTGESYRPEGVGDAPPQAEVEQHPTEELTAGDTEEYGGPAQVADTTPDADTAPPAGTVPDVEQAGAGTGEGLTAGDDDAGRTSDAARIGAMGAAGVAGAGVAVGAAGSGATAARPLSDEDVSEGARQEPLPVSDQEHPAGTTTPAEEVAPAESYDARATDETDHRSATEESYDAHPTTDDRSATEEQTWTDDRTTREADAPTTQEPLTADEVLAASDEGRDRDASGGVEPTTGTSAAGARGAGYAGTDGSEGAAGAPGTAAAPGSDVDRGAAEHEAPAFAESVYGPGSADPLEDGTGPAGWEIKGNVGSMLFHTTDSPSYDAVRAEVWFESEQAARDAGFAHWDRRRR